MSTFHIELSRIASLLNRQREKALSSNAFSDAEVFLDTCVFLERLVKLSKNQKEEEDLFKVVHLLEKKSMEMERKGNKQAHTSLSNSVLVLQKTQERIHLLQCQVEELQRTTPKDECIKDEMENDDVKREMKNQMEEIGILKRQEEEIKKQEMKDQMEAMKTENQEMKIQMDEMQILKRQEEDMNKEMEEMRMEKQEMKDQMDELKMEKQEMKTQMDEMKIQMESMKNQEYERIHASEEKIKKIQQQHQLEFNKMQTEIQNKQHVEEEESWKSKWKQVSLECTTWQEKMDVLEEKSLEMQNEMKEQNTTLIAQIQELEEKYVEEKKVHEAMNKKVQEAEERQVSLQDVITDLKNKQTIQVDETNNEIAENQRLSIINLENDLQALKTEHDTIVTQLQESQDQIVENEAKFEERCEEYAVEIQTMTFHAEEGEEMRMAYAAEIETLRNASDSKDTLVETNNDDLLLDLKKEKEGLQQHVVQLQSEVEATQATREEKEGQHVLVMESLKNELRDVKLTLGTNCSEANIEMELVKSQRAQAETQLHNVESELEKIRHEVETLKGRNSSLPEDASVQITLWKTRAGNVREALKVKSLRVETLEKEIIQLQKLQETKMCMRCDVLQNEFDTLNLTWKDLVASHAELQSQYETIVQTHTIQVQEMQQQCLETGQREMNETPSETCCSCESLEKGLVELQDGMSLKEAAVGELHDAMSLKETEFQEAGNLHDSKVKELQEDLALQDSTVTELHEAMTLKEKRVVELQEEMTLKEARVSELQEAVGLHEVSVKQLQESLELKDSTMQEMQSTLQQATQLHESKQLELQHVQEQHDTTQRHCTELNAQLKHLKSTVESSSSSSASQLESLKLTFATFKTRAHTALKKVEERASRLGPLHVQVEELRTKNEALVQQLEETHLEKETLAVEMNTCISTYREKWEMSTSDKEADRQRGEKSTREKALQKVFMSCSHRERLVKSVAWQKWKSLLDESLSVAKVATVVKECTTTLSKDTCT